MKTKIARWGNSLALRIPKAIGDRLGLAAGSPADIDLDATGFRVVPTPTALPGIPRLHEIVDEMRRLGPDAAPVAIDWGADRGTEIIDDAYSRGEIALGDLPSGTKRASGSR